MLVPGRTMLMKDGSDLLFGGDRDCIGGSQKMSGPPGRPGPPGNPVKITTLNSPFLHDNFRKATSVVVGMSADRGVSKNAVRLSRLERANKTQQLSLSTLGDASPLFRNSVINGGGRISAN